MLPYVHSNEIVADLNSELFTHINMNYSFALRTAVQWQSYSEQIIPPWEEYHCKVSNEKVPFAANIF